MKQHTIKPLIAAVLLAASCAAQAAHFELVSYQAFGGYSGSANGELFSDDAQDLSQGGDAYLFGANVFTTTGIEHSYAADASFFQAGQNFSMSLSQSLKSAVGSIFSGDTLMSVPSLKLKIVGDGEAIGSNVAVSVAVTADAINSYAANTGYSSMDVSITAQDGSTSNAIIDFSTEQMKTEAFTFGFNGKIGDEYLLSGNMMGNLSSNGLQMIDSSTSSQLVGTLSVVAVPEPEQYAMLLAGLGVLGAVARRRAAR